MKIYSVLFGEIKESILVIETKKGFRVTTVEGGRQFETVVYRQKKFARGFLGGEEYNTQRSFADLDDALFCAQVQINEYANCLINEECILDAKRNKLVELNYHR
jgi:hypothetical protein